MIPSETTRSLPLMEGKKVLLAAAVPSELRSALQELARRNERSASAELRLALKSHLAKARQSQRNGGDR